MLSVISVYFLFLLTYPAILVYAALGQPQLVVTWLLIGIAVLLLVKRFLPSAAKFWFALWFLPATIICGAAAITPWPIGLQHMPDATGCVTVASLSICLVLNLGLVYFVCALFGRLRHRRPVA